MRKKKEAFKRMKEDGSMEASQEYKNSKREAKRVAAIAKARSTETWYNELETKKSQDKVFRIAKAKHRTKKRFWRCCSHTGWFREVSDRRISDKRERWMEYYRQLLNTENDEE